MNELAGRTALVTGSTHGIGREVALQLAAAGASVAVHGRSAEAAATLAAVLAADSFCIGLASDFGNETDSDGRFGGLALVEVLISYALKITPKSLLEAVRHEPLNGCNQ